jgi:hypothetical protein
MSNERKMLRPKVPGSIVRDPDSKIPLAQEGEEKSVNPATAPGRFWLRRIAEEDVIVVPSVQSVTTKGEHKALPKDSKE